MTRFCLDVAGARIRVAAPPAWAGGLADRYAAFLTRKPPHWDLELACGPAPALHDPPSVTHDGPLTQFRLPGCCGWIDLPARRAYAAAPSEQLAAAALERTAGYVLIQALPRDHAALWLHAVGVIRNGLAYVFFGPSGAGKTTIAHLAEGHGDMMGDENVVIRLDPGGASVFATPFWGHSTPPALIDRRRRSAPLAGLFALEHGPSFALTPLAPAEAVDALLRTEKVPGDRLDSAAAWLAVAGPIVACAPAYLLTFRPDAALWSFLSGQGT